MHYTYFGKLGISHFLYKITDDSGVVNPTQPPYIRRRPSDNFGVPILLDICTEIFSEMTIAAST